MKNLRFRIAFWLVKLADKIYPTGHATAKFIGQLMMDSMIYGNAFTRIDPKEVFKNEYQEER
jgi:hypothetical protein